MSSVEDPAADGGDRLERQSKMSMRKLGLMSVVVTLAAFGLGMLLGNAIGHDGDPTQSIEYRNLQRESDARLHALHGSQARSESLEQEIDFVKGNIPDREAIVQERERRLIIMTKKYKHRVAELEKREAHVRSVLGSIARTSIPGDGVYRVGPEMRPGTYRSAGGGSCYWQLSSDANGANILTNHIGAGPALTTVAAGQFFQTQRCGVWRLL